MGTPQAITATAHTLARLVYSRLMYGPADVVHGLEADEPQHDPWQVRPMARKACALGFQLVPATATVERGWGNGWTARPCLRHSTSPPRPPYPSIVVPWEGDCRPGDLSGP
jgi:hypothetical protein